MLFDTTRKLKDLICETKGSVDFILTHTCPSSIVQEMFVVPPIYDVTGEFLDIIRERLPDTPWYFGHWHEDKDWGRFHCLFNRVLKIL